MNRTLSLVIPVYNEAQHLEQFLTAIDQLELAVAKDLVIIDDGSTDGSAEVLRKFSFNSPVVLISQTQNKGKGAAVRAGIERATGDIIGIQDADLETNIADIPSLIEPLIQDRADVVYGSRFKKSGVQVHRTFHYLVNRVLTALSNIMSGLYLTDMETCYKFFRADVIKNIKLESNRFGFEPEVTARIARLNLRVMELPVTYFPRKYLEGKKMNWKDGVAAVFHIFYFNLRNNRTRYFTEALPAHYILESKQ
jgi:glycosyltransferase involved in cell wall biosynthesis